MIVMVSLWYMQSMTIKCNLMTEYFCSNSDGHEFKLIMRMDFFKVFIRIPFWNYCTRKETPTDEFELSCKVFWQLIWSLDFLLFRYICILVEEILCHQWKIHFLFVEDTDLLDRSFEKWQKRIAKPNMLNILSFCI